MKGFGIFLLTVGVITFLAGFGMDTSVSSGLGGRVHNIGLINEKQNIIVLAGVITVIGALFFGFASKNERNADQSSSTRTCPFCAEEIRPEAKICRFCHNELSEGANSLSRAERTLALKRSGSSDDLGGLYTEVSRNLAKHAPFLLGLLALITFGILVYLW